MSVAVCRNVFLFVISVNRNNTKSFLSASRLVTPSVWKGAHTGPVRAHPEHSTCRTALQMMWCWASCSWNQGMLCLWQPKPPPVLVRSQRGTGNNMGMNERLHLKAAVSLSESKANPAWAHSTGAGLCFAIQTVPSSRSWSAHTAPPEHSALLSEQPGSSTGLKEQTLKSDWGKKIQV